MALVFHLSSLNIDQNPSSFLMDLAKDISSQKPDLIVISGNIVKKATIENFKAAQSFLETFSAPVFCVSGNHDLSLFGKDSRFFDPFLLYRDYISPTQDCVYEDDHVYVVGINSARAFVPHFKLSNGMVSQNQIQFVHNQFRYAPNEKVRIFVCHHPLVKIQKNQ